MVDYIADPKVYGDLEHYGWTTEEEEDYDLKGKEETSSDEEEVPLSQPRDMHVEFKKSSLPNEAKKPKIEFIPFSLLQENKQELCRRILTLEQEIVGILGPPSIVSTLTSNGYFVTIATCSFRINLILLLTISHMNLAKVGIFNISLTCNEI